MPLNQSETTVAAASQEIHAPVRQESSQRHKSYFIFTLCAIVYLLPFMRVFLPWNNEGEFIYGAVRIVHGQVFARDFFEVMGPGTFCSLAAFFKLFGVTFLVARIYLFLMSLGTGLLVYFLAHRLCGKYRIVPCILLAATYYGLQWPGISIHVDSNFFALLSVACMVLWQDRRRKSLLLVAGAVAGLTTCFLQQKGILLICSILLWLWIQRPRRAATFSAMGWAVGGYLSIVGLVLAYFWSQGALSSLVYANVLWPSTHYSAVNAVPYAQGILRQYWDRWASVSGAFHWPIAVAVVVITPFLFVAALPWFMALYALLPILPRRYRWKDLAPELVLCWLCGWALWLSEVHRKDIGHLVFGAPLLTVLCIHLLQASPKKYAHYALQILGITAAWLATLNFLGVLTAHPVMTRVGSVAMSRDAPGLAFVNAHVAPGEEMFVYPNCPIYYFFSSTTNPTRYSNLIYNYNTTSQFQEVIQVLDRRKVRYVLWDTNFEAKTVATLIPEEARTPPDGFLMESYLESHYNLVKEEDGYRIMERKGAEPAN